MAMKFRYCRALVREAGIFAAPMEGCGDLKPVYYLAAALAESGRSSRAIRAMVLRLVGLEVGGLGTGHGVTEAMVDRGW